MAQYANIFLLLNLGVEMVYIIAHRLNAQGVPLHRSALVLNQIVSVLVSKELISDATKTPQPVYTREQLKNTMADIAQSSIMRLDPISMDKLWDLVAMVFKWQITASSNLLKITQRHVSELENYISGGEVLLQLRKVQTIIDNFGVLLSGDELQRLRSEILEWLNSSNIKVSLLLKMGMQNADGSFVSEETNRCRRRVFDEDILENLGQSIYDLTPQQNKEKSDNINNNEVNLLVNQLLGGESDPRSEGGSQRTSRLTLNIGEDDRRGNRNRQSESATADIRSNEKRDSIRRFNCAEQKNNVSDLSHILKDFYINETTGSLGNSTGASDYKEELLELIVNDDVA